MSEVRSGSMPQTSSRRPMQVVSEREVADPPELPAPTTTTIPSSTSSPTATTTSDLNAELISRYAWRQGLLGALAAINQVLAIRAVLLVSVLGAIFLAYLALAQDDVFRLGVLAVYCAVVVAPIVALTYRRG